MHIVDNIMSRSKPNLDPAQHGCTQSFTNNSFWEQVVHSIAEAIGVVDLDGRVRFANASWCELLGGVGSVHDGEHVSQVVHPLNRPVVQPLVAAALQGESIVGHPCRLRQRDANWRDVLITSSPMRDASGAIIGASILLADVGNRYTSDGMHDIGALSIAHELRTPVTIIGGLTELLLRKLKRYGTLDPVPLARYLHTIQQQVQRLAGLGANLAPGAPAPHAQLCIRREPTDLVELVATCVTHHCARGPAPLPNRLVVAPPTVPVSVHVERWRIAYVINTLLALALKHAPAAHTITVCIRVDRTWAHVQISDVVIPHCSPEPPQPGAPCVDVPYASILIPDAARFDVSYSTAIAHAHGGTIQVQGDIQHGRTYTLTLPRDGE